MVSMEVPEIPVIAKKLLMRSVYQLDRVQLGFTTQTELIVSYFFQDLGLYMSASYWTSLSAPLGSVYLLYTVCNLMFSYFRIFKRVFCECCHLPRDLSVFFSVDWENSS